MKLRDLNDEATLEKAARELCELRGTEPDAMVRHNMAAQHGMIPLGLTFSPAWKLAAQELKNYYAILCVITTDE